MLARMPIASFVLCRILRTHAKPLRETANYRENVFRSTIEGNPLIDKAYDMVLEVV